MDEALFTGRLMSGERILWTGRPAVGVLFTSRDFFMVPFSLFFLGFSIFWMAGATAATSAASASGRGFDIFFPLFGVPFILAGLFFTMGRFAADAWLRGRTAYALTNRRILISRAGPFSSFTALPLGQLPDVRLSEDGRGRGTIRFGAAASLWNNRSMAVWMPSLDPTPQFLAIDGVRSVFDRIQELNSKPGG